MLFPWHGIVSEALIFNIGGLFVEAALDYSTEVDLTGKVPPTLTRADQEM